ncbi:hypothetical protein GSI_07271 [Ganoderma sinense ZZ0214-1]|uniref:F-box domain-containing protein n=1 Tax=Ganoderma sinense ZZ0214-1 TaxID=1077348 RepID=A0A2G8SA01_9APHY|nr:hypothetical protein GSI_07271 [Ganoderma sinense ZZ0214-1]
MNFSAATSPHVPFDVQLLVLDQCHKEKLSLFACSLVCRAWLGPTRVHLFRDTTIKVPHRTDEPVRKFIHALLLSETELGRNVTTLRIVGSDRFTPWIRLRNPYSPMVLTIAFYPMFSRLPRLRRLSFVNVRFVTLDFAMSHFVCDDDDIRPSLDYLEINSCLDDGDKANGTVNFITLFASIRTLVLDLEHYGNTLQRSVERIPHNHPVSIRSIILRGMVDWWSSCLSHHFRHAVPSSGDVPHPSECLNIWPHWGREWTQLKGIGSFVELNAPTIRALRINSMQLMVAKPEENLAGHWHELRLASCVHLRSLLFSLDTTDFAPDQIPDAVRRAHESILEILMDPALPAALECVMFHLTVPVESHPALAAFNWEFVDEVLARSVRRLRAVVIEFAAGSVAPTEKLAQRLANTRGILEFRVGETGVPWWEVPV